MSCLPDQSELAGSAHFAGRVVLAQPQTDAPQDPIAAWLDLMEVVEALCPQWPQRTPRQWTDFRL